jgi:hypothetical protein
MVFQFKIRIMEISFEIEWEKIDRGRTGTYIYIYMDKEVI